MADFHLVIAGFAAGFAVQEAVGAEANAFQRIAQAAILDAIALVFRGVALTAHESTVQGSHDLNVSRREWWFQVSFVTSG